MFCGQERVSSAPGEQVEAYFRLLLQHFGPQRWWPARTRIQIVLGAILTQNTAWTNALRALAKLRRAGRLTWPGLQRAPLRELESCVRPAGFFRQKARTIYQFVKWVNRAYGGSLARLFAQPPGEFRAQLLALRGIGPETADAILLYAGRHPFFVADAYTRRVLERHALIPPHATYEATQKFLHRHLPLDPALFNEFHALLVEVGKHHCRRAAPRCSGCPLERFLPGSEETAGHEVRVRLSEEPLSVNA